ncbi:MAG TPA: hypothetical protein VE526_16755 [Solirubrobacteraceae bacterium]|nr:hypothetical protein [Solirubrobacteraceae bacterium]
MHEDWRAALVTGAAGGIGRAVAARLAADLIGPDEVTGVVACLAGSGGRAFSGVPVPMDPAWTAR